MWQANNGGSMFGFGAILNYQSALYDGVPVVPTGQHGSPWLWMRM